MPRIPLANKAGLIQHQRSSVPMSGAPGMDFGMDEARAGARLLDASGSFVNSAGRLLSSMAQFQQEERDTNDKLMATEDRNLLASSAGELDKTLADNPGWDDKQKQDAIDKWRKSYTEKRKPFLDKMSAKFRTQHEAVMRGVENQYAQGREKILIQGKVQRDTELAQAQINTAVQQGRTGDADSIVTMHTGKLWTPAKAEEMRLAITSQGAYYDAKRRIDAGTPGMEEELKKSGSFPGLSEQHRDSLLRYARAKEAERSSAADDAVCASFVSGKAPFSAEELEKQKEEKQISDKQYIRYKGYLDSFNAKQKRAADYQASQQEKAETAARKQQYNRLMLNLQYDAFGYARSLDAGQFAGALNDLRAVCGKDYDLMEQGLKALNELRTKEVKYRDSQLYKDGDLYLSGLKAQGKLGALQERTFWWGKEGGDTKPATVAFVERNLRMFLEQYVAGHPQATAAELQTEIDKKVSEYNKKSVEEIAAFSLSQRAVQRGEEAVKARSLHVGTIENGYVFAGGDPRKKENWKKVKQINR